MRDDLKEYMESVDSSNAPKFSDKNDFYYPKAKELSGLEALKKIDFDLNYEITDDNGYSLETPIKVRDFLEEEISTIEKELKDYYALKKECEEAKWYQEHKALEIIKREPSMVGWQAGYEDYEDYLDNTPEEQRYINSKEEYDLLKEVL